MTSAKNITSLARRWQKMAAKGRKAVSLPRTDEKVDADGSTKSQVAQKGHFVVYTKDQKRFEFPIMYLNNNIFQELLKLSEEEFGLSIDGPITLPFDAIFMDFVVSFIKRGEAECLEKEFVTSITDRRCTFSSTFPNGSTGQHSVVCGY